MRYYISYLKMILEPMMVYQAGRRGSAWDERGAALARSVLLLRNDAWRSAALVVRTVMGALVRAGLGDVRAGLGDVRAALAIHGSTHAETLLVLSPVSGECMQE